MYNTLPQIHFFPVQKVHFPRKEAELQEVVVAAGYTS